MRATPYTNNELFNRICDMVTLPEGILDYAKPAPGRIPITGYNWDVWSSLRFGANEGIYLDIGAIFQPGNRIIRLGTFKTLQTDLDAMRKMGRLLADIVYMVRDFVNNNLDDFDWTGYEVRGIRNEKTDPHSVTYETREKALDTVRKTVDHYDAVQLYDRPAHRYEYYSKDSDGKLQKFEDLGTCLAAASSFDPFDGHEVPAALKEMVEEILKTWAIHGLCDGMYIANVIANESGTGDGMSHFEADAGTNVPEPERIAARLQFAYSSTIPKTDLPELVRILSHHTNEK